MLDAYVIEEIKRRERDQSRDDRRPVLELPIPQPVRRPGGDDRSERDDERDDRKDRGVVIIDLG